MSDLEKARAAIDKGDATALLGLADALCDSCHPNAVELVQLAVDVASADDWAVAVMAGTLFLTILEGSKQ